MIHFYLVNGVVMQISNETPETDWIQNGIGWANRNDVDSEEFAQSIADQLFAITGDVYLIDGLQRNRVHFVKAPKIGDDVSAGFNGDYDYVGKIYKIGKNFSNIYVRDANGVQRVFRRLKGAASFHLNHQYMVNGVRNERNPHF